MPAEPAETLTVAELQRLCALLRRARRRACLPGAEPQPDAGLSGRARVGRPGARLLAGESAGSGARGGGGA